MPDRTAVIVPIRLPARLATVRAAGDLMAARGVPAHVTVLFPFLAPDALTPGVRSALADLARTTPPFVARFDEVERRDEMVWLVPAGQRSFLTLTDAVFGLWPDHPPYGGAHDELVAHLTLVESPDIGTRDAAWTAATGTGPFEVEVRELTVITENAAGRWRTRWRLPMGAGSARTG